MRRVPGRGWRAAGAVCAALAMLSLPLQFLLAQSPVQAQTDQVQDDKPENYPAGPHRDDTFYFCSACHSFKIIAQQGMTRDQWDETLVLMVQKHAMPNPDPKERELFLDYLTSAFPPRQSGGWQNPFQP